MGESNGPRRVTMAADGPWAVAAFFWSAARDGDEAECARLLCEGGDPNRPDPGGESAVHLAALNGKVGALRLLLAGGGALEGRNKYGETPLLKAAAWGMTGASALLLEAGADTGARNEAGLTPEEAAVRHGKRETVMLLTAWRERASIGENTQPADCEVRTAPRL